MDGDAVKQLAEYLAKYRPEVELYTIKDPEGQEGAVLVAPRDVSIIKIEEYLRDFRDNPKYRSGTVQVDDLASFIAHVNRFKDDQSAIFGDRGEGLHGDKGPSLLAIHDYDEPTGGKPRFGRHRTHYALPISDEWETWTEANDAELTQAEFAAFIQDQIADVLDPASAVAGTAKDSLLKVADLLGTTVAPPIKLLEVSRNLTVNATKNVKQAVTLETGEVQLTYEEVHNTSQGKVPSLFAIGIPVFRNGSNYVVPVRLRYALSGTSVRWKIRLYRADRVFKAAFDELCAKAGTDTGLPVFQGRPSQ